MNTDMTFPALTLSGADPLPARKLRICIASFDFIGPVRNGGVGTAFTSLGEALAAAGHHVTFLYLSGSHCETHKPLEHWIAEYRKKGIAFVPLPDQCGPRLDTTWPMSKPYQAYQWLLGQPRFDVVHFSEWRAPGYFSLVAKHQGLAFADTQLCVHTHGPTLWSLLSNGEYVSMFAELELDFMERESVRLADTVVSPSQYLLRWMTEQEWTLPPRTFVQQYVRPTAARPPAQDRGFAVQPVREIVFFGRLEVRKGLVLFCDALDRLKADPAMHGVKITFLGKITQVQNTKGEDYLRDRTKDWPWEATVISDRDQYGALDYLQGPGRIAVIPSMVDNLPNTVLECLGARVPFLASTTGGIPEMLAPEDAAEMLFPLRPAEFAQKMKAAVQHGLRPARFAVEPEENRRIWTEWHATGAYRAPAAAIPAAGELPLVSICLSHFNRPHFLRQALASIETQDYRRIEVVLVDDASTDPDAIAYLDSLAPVFAQRGWQLIRNQEELFVGAARNLAARHARGEFVKFMDDDNVAKPKEISTFVAVSRRTGADIVSCALDVFTETTMPRPNQVPHSRFLFMGAAAAATAIRNYVGDTNSLFRREVFLALGGFHEERHVGHEDWKLMGAAVLKGYRLEAIPDALVWYRRTGTGQNASVRNSQQAGHMQNILPYLQAVPPALRNLVLYAQGNSLRQNEFMVRESMRRENDLKVLWKSKLEAGIALAAEGQGTAAAKLMLAAVKSVETCKVPGIIVDAILETAPHLAPLDPGRARFLVNLAVKTTEAKGRTADHERALKVLAALGSPARISEPLAKAS
ncbi:MAG TPA: glycosyltransferase [Lacunisphaera sp.]|nr:glycosyltransferase [Lacunisphaera sp.]